MPEVWIGQLVVVRRTSGHEHMVVIRDVRGFGVVYTMVGRMDPVFSLDLLDAARPGGHATL